ncbi:MAG: hypothetical protein AVDCRST_MAG64-3528 [uncultured Phycisphaerae bacterium]|uniref:Uncharacterized protein n=1 Tax=uncultured Phycisphaerae bacterium TaxID=904963 RepID=A0A6J4Q0W4_9BACT|nr:MAG: hypothetical protein AVDCRST_MAG64-3528 [uncultured Phycisphaerae bacterium]
MFGNKEGWALSVAIVALVGLMLWKFDMLTAPAMAAPSGQFRNLRAPIALPVKPADALPGVMTEDLDAGDLYWKAIKVYQASPETYDKAQPRYTTRLDKLPAIDLLVEATAANRATIFMRKPATLVNYGYPGPEMEALYNLGRVANSIAFSSQADGDEARTKKYAYACFSLGAKLYDERLIHGELDAGIKLMQTAGDSLATLARKQGNEAEAAKWKQFTDATSRYYTTEIQELVRKVLGAGAIDLRKHSGDVFELALHNPDRMWQVEALLKIGRYKYEMGGTLGDQIWANRLLHEPARHGLPDFTNHKDPAVARAATIARDLTVEELRMIR